MSDNKTVYVITNLKEDLNGLITNVDENNVEIVWENEEKIQLTNEELEALLETEDFEISEKEITEDEGGETPAQASIKTHKSADATDGDADGNPKTRLDWIRRIVGQMADMDTESLTKIFNDQQAMVGGEAERAGVANNAGKNQSTITMKPSAATGRPVAESIVKLQKEEMDALFGETELTEEFKSKISTLFETAVVVRLSEEVVKIQEAFDAKLEENINSLSNTLIENLNDYLDNVVKEWLTTNEVAIESTLRTELTMGFLDGLKNLFNENYIEIPEDKVNVYESLVADFEKSQEDLNKAVNESIEKDKVIKGLQKDKIVSELAVGLTLPQREKLKSLTEAVEFENDESFKTKAKAIKEGFVDSQKKDSNILSEGIVDKDNKEIVENDDPMMKAALQAIKRTKNIS